MSDTPKRPRPRVYDTNYNQVGRSKKHEKRIAKEFGGKRLPGSGNKIWSEYDRKATAPGIAMKTAQGDISTPNLWIEHKNTINKSMSVKLEWLLKVKEGASTVGKDPALVITFDRGLQPAEDWIAVPMSVFKRLTGQGE